MKEIGKIPSGFNKRNKDAFTTVHASTMISVHLVPLSGEYLE